VALEALGVKEPSAAIGTGREVLELIQAMETVLPGHAGHLTA